MSRNVEFLTDLDGLALINCVKEELQIQGAHDNLISAAQRLCVSTPLGTGNFLSDLQSKFSENGVETCIKNALVLAKRRRDVKDEHEPLTYMKRAQSHFEKRISKALLALHTDLKLSLVRYRNQNEMEELSSKWNELSSYDPDVSSIRILYSNKDLFEAVTSLRDPNYSTNRLEEMWSSIKVPLTVPTFEDLRTLLRDVYISDEPYLGLGPSDLVLKTNANMTLLSQRIALGTKVVAENDILLSEEFVKGGCPPHYRAQLWKTILLVKVGDKERSYFNAKRQSVLQTEYLTDKLIIKDIQLTVSRDEHYFLFEDLIYQVALCFSRDPYVYSQLSSKLGLKTVSRHVPFQIPGHANAYPPSGFIPFCGWSMYVAPLCYIHEKVEDIYFILRSMYLKYWCRLHRISSNPQGIVSLSILFERILQRQEPELWIHCLNNNIQPLKLVLPWIAQAFSGFLVPAQLLFLWDLILGIDSLYVLPLLAAAILSLRRENLHRIQTHEAAESVCHDLSTIQVIPLLQMALTQGTEKIL